MNHAVRRWLYAFPSSQQPGYGRRRQQHRQRNQRFQRGPGQPRDKWFGHGHGNRHHSVGLRCLVRFEQWHESDDLRCDPWICAPTASQYDSSFAGSLPGSDTNSNFKITSDQNTSASGVNSLVVNNANVTLNGGEPSPSNPAHCLPQTPARMSPPRSPAAFCPSAATGGSEAIIHTAANHSLAISSTISGNNGLTKSGQGTPPYRQQQFHRARDNRRRHAGCRFRREPGASTNAITLASRLEPTANYTSIPAARDITVVGLANAFNIPSGQTLTVNGNISGDQYSTLRKTGPGTLVLAPSVSNSYLGGTTVLGGTLKVGLTPRLAPTAMFRARTPRPRIQATPSP